MKRYLMLLLLIILFILPFSCDGCQEDDNNSFTFYRSVVQGEYTIIDLNTSSNAWDVHKITPPLHAQFYQLDTDESQGSYMFFYRTRTDFIGFDTTKVQYTHKTLNDTWEFHTIIINTIEDTSQSN